MNDIELEKKLGDIARKIDDTCDELNLKIELLASHMKTFEPKLVKLSSTYGEPKNLGCFMSQIVYIEIVDK